MWAGVSRPNITYEELTSLYRYDPDTGFLYGKKKATPLGHVGIDGYVRLMIKRKMYAIHRLAWLYMTGDWPKGLIHHKNRNKCDNRFANLADVTPSENIERRCEQGQCEDNLYWFLGMHHTDLSSR